MGFRLSHAFISVDDQDAALAFYRDTIGLEVTNDVDFDGLRWLTVRAKGQPDVEIMLEHVGMGRSAEDADALRALLAKGALTGVIFQVDDVDELFEKVRVAGYEVLQEPTDQGYGVRDCAFRDPSGNMVRFSQPFAA
jgi:catechol 2,3-dioxygenase-like lactoylglutathione lyase family enzyme